MPDDNEEWLASRHIDLDNPPPEAKLYVELYEREKAAHDKLKKEHAQLWGEHQADKQVAMNTKTVPLSIFQKTELELREAKALHRNTLNSSQAIELERHEFKARIEAMLSKPDPGHPAGNGKPWARAEEGEVYFGLLADGEDEEAYDVEMAESMASSLWRAAMHARSQLRVVPPPGNDECGCTKGRHPQVHWSVAEERWQEWATSLWEETGWTCRLGWPIPRPTDDETLFRPPGHLYRTPRVDPNHKPEARNLCTCCDCNGHEVVSGPPEAEDLGRCRICKLTQAEIDELEKIHAS